MAEHLMGLLNPGNVVHACRPIAGLVLAETSRFGLLIDTIVGIIGSITGGWLSGVFGLVLDTKV